MPTYDYVCDECGSTLEIFQAFSDSPKKKCPQCKKSKLRRVISGGVGLVFKGSGFYVTDSRGAVSNISKKSDSKTDAAKPDASQTKTSDGVSKETSGSKPAETATKSKSPAAASD